jgi:phenylpropionate dioxygenase-like ring-hydroxylating dioxygenase large terminal subunit
MGDLMRQCWIPAALSSELERDSAPIRLMLLGEKLIAFRDSTGHVGVMDHRCPHRCASLFLGRNEEGGIRCIYHGWKYDVAGNCIDMDASAPGAGRLRASLNRPFCLTLCASTPGILTRVRVTAASGGSWQI